MTLPRMAAIAEIAWAYDRKDYDDFEKRAKRLLPELYGKRKTKILGILLRGHRVNKAAEKRVASPPCGLLFRNGFSGNPDF